MQALGNININGKEYGVLVSDTKHGRLLKLAKAPITKPTISLSDEQLAIDSGENNDAIRLFLMGQTIAL